MPTPRSDAVAVAVADGRATVALTGDFEMAATFNVEPVLEQLLDREELEALTVDLSGVRFIDSTGVGVLLRLVDEAAGRGVALTIVPGPREVQRVFEVAGVLETLPFAAR